MAEINMLRSATKTVLRDIAKHASNLAVGLQNAAPPQEGGPGKSVIYLTDIAAFLQEKIKEIDPNQE